MFSSNLKSRCALLASLLLGFTRAQTAYESIFTLDAFGVQPICVQSCFIQGYANIDCYTDVLGSRLGCANTPCASTFAAVDDCYCREDLQTAAHGLLSSCIDQLCSVGDNSVNLATAAGVYSDYCTARGFMALLAPKTAAASSQGAGGITASTTASAQSGPTSTSSSTGSSSTASPSPASSTNNTLIIALACVGALAVIAILAAATICWKVRLQKQPPPPSSYPLDPVRTTSTERLRPSLQSWPSGLPDDTASNNSVFQAGRTARMWQNYNHWEEDSMATTSVCDDQRSMVGRGRNIPR